MQFVPVDGVLVMGEDEFLELKEKSKRKVCFSKGGAGFVGVFFGGGAWVFVFLGFFGGG